MKVSEFITPKQIAFAVHTKGDDNLRVAHATFKKVKDKDLDDLTIRECRELSIFTLSQSACFGDDPNSNDHLTIIIKGLPVSRKFNQ